jgi:hypothetical protein
MHIYDTIMKRKAGQQQYTCLVNKSNILSDQHMDSKYIGGYWVIVFNATFNNISAISWWSVFLVEESGIL